MEVMYMEIITADGYTVSTADGYQVGVTDQNGLEYPLTFMMTSKSLTFSISQNRNLTFAVDQ